MEIFLYIWLDSRCFLNMFVMSLLCSIALYIMPDLKIEIFFRFWNSYFIFWGFCLFFFFLLSGKWLLSVIWSSLPFLLAKASENFYLLAKDTASVDQMYGTTRAEKMEPARETQLPSFHLSSCHNKAYFIIIFTFLTVVSKDLHSSPRYSATHMTGLGKSEMMTSLQPQLSYIKKNK